MAGSEVCSLHLNLDIPIEQIGSVYASVLLSCSQIVNKAKLKILNVDSQTTGPHFPG